jgi:hypothetical protein
VSQNKVKDIATKEIAKAIRPVPTWNPLEQGWLKLNSDANFVHTTGEASTCVVVSNN